MFLLIIGLMIFFAAHSVRIVAGAWREQQIARWGLNVYRGLYGLVSLLGLALIVVGFGKARLEPVILWFPPYGLRHLAGLMLLVSFVLLAAAYVPGNRIKAKLGHPVLAGIKTWALAHLLAAGSLADVLLFGSFLAWAVVDFSASRRRDRETGTVYPAGTAQRDWVTVAVGVVAWALFAFWLHGWLIGIRPFG